MPADFWQKIGAAASTLVNALVCASDPACLGQMIYKGLVALGTFLVNLAQAIVDWGMKQLGALWNTIVAVVQKAGEVLQEVANWAIRFLNEMIDAVLGPFKSALRSEGLRVTASSAPDASIHDSSGRRDYLSSLWDVVGSGMFFNIVLAAVVALQIIAAIAVNVIMPGGGSLVAKLVETAIVGFIVSAIVGGLVFLILIGLDAVFKSVVPASDPFWAEGAGLDVLGTIGDVTAILLNWERISKPGMSVFKALKELDAGWLVLSLVGLAVTLLSVNYSGLTALGFSVVGVALAFIGGLGVMGQDPIDRLPFSVAPLKYLEESLALISLGYALADFARTASEV